MAAEMSITVITPEHTILKAVDTDAVIIPIVGGSMGILRRHAPMVAALRIGILKFKSGGRYEPIAIDGGFAEVSNDRIMVLTDAAERAGDIDVLRARQARERAEARLRDRESNVDAARARRALSRALIRLRVAGALDDE